LGDRQLNGDGFANNFTRHIGNGFQVILLQPVTGKRIGGTDAQDLPIEGLYRCRFNPRFKRWPTQQQL